MKIALAPLAKADLKDIQRYIYTESGSEKTADRLLDKLGHTMANLQKTPNIGRSRSDDLGRDLRSFPCGNYVIFYRIDKGVVRVIRILHGRRDLRSLLSQGQAIHCFVRQTHPSVNEWCQPRRQSFKRFERARLQPCRKSSGIVGLQPLRECWRINPRLKQSKIADGNSGGLHQLYRREGIYHYSKGINPCAVLALVSGVFVAIIGVWMPMVSFLYDYAWFVGFFVAGLTYAGLMWVFPAPIAEDATV